MGAAAGSVLAAGLACTGAGSGLAATGAGAGAAWAGAGVGAAGAGVGAAATGFTGSGLVCACAAAVLSILAGCFAAPSLLATTGLSGAGVAASTLGAGAGADLVASGCVSVLGAGAAAVDESALSAATFGWRSACLVAGAESTTGLAVSLTTVLVTAALAEASVDCACTGAEAAGVAAGPSFRCGLLSCLPG